MKTKIFYKKEMHLVDITSIQNYQSFVEIVRATFQNLPKNYLFKIHHENGSIIDKLTYNSLHKLSIALSKICIVDISETELQQIEISQREFSRLQFDLSDHSQNQTHCIEIDTELSDHKDIINHIKANIIDSSPQFLRKNEQKQSMFLIKREQQEYPISLKKQKNIVCDDVQCDRCFSFPIIGPIYKCLVCKQFDLCQNCQQKYHHFHPVLKIQKNNHYPTQIRVIFTKQQQLYMNSQLEAEQLSIKEQKEFSLKQNKKNDQIQIDADMLDSKTRKAKNFLSALGF